MYSSEIKKDNDGPMFKANFSEALKLNVGLRSTYESLRVFSVEYSSLLFKGA